MDAETVYPGLLYQRSLDTLNNKELLSDCLEINRFLYLTYPLVQKDPGQYGSAATANFRKYNLFTFVRSSLCKLFQEIKLTISPYLSDESYVIRSWLNAMEKGHCLPWHGHWPPAYRAWHGFYCVDTEPESFTTYKFDKVENEIIIPSKDGLLVFGVSNNDLHKTSPWHDEKRPRVTVAFDIVPVSSLLKENKYQFTHNHFIPFKA